MNLKKHLQADNLELPSDFFSKIKQYHKFLSTTAKDILSKMLEVDTRNITIELLGSTLAENPKLIQSVFGDNLAFLDQSPKNIINATIKNPINIENSKDDCPFFIFQLLLNK